MTTELTPYLSFTDAARAIDFYAEAFGATEVGRIGGPGDRIGHAELRIGDVRIYLSDEFPEMGVKSAETMGGTPVMLALTVDDADATVERAVAAGAEVTRPVEDQFYGERGGQVLDPFGYRWGISHRTEELSFDEMERRAAAQFGPGGGGDGGDR